MSRYLISKIAGLSLFAIFPMNEALGAGIYFSSGLYCVETAKTLDVFAGRVVRGGDLKFGISRWRGDGQGFQIVGQAKPYRDGWKFVESTNQPKSGCSIEFTISKAGNVHVLVDRYLTCDEYGGHGFSQKSLVIDARFRRGSENGLLNDPDNFLSDQVCSKRSHHHGSN